MMYPIAYCIYIYKEELKTVVRDILACAQPNCHKTYTALWTPYHRVSSRGQRAQIRFSPGARGEKPENDRPPFWFYGENIGKGKVGGVDEEWEGGRMAGYG